MWRPGGEPIEQEVRADADGRALFAGMPLGSAVLHASTEEGWFTEPLRVRIEGPPGTRTRAELTLDPGGLLRLTGAEDLPGDVYFALSRDGRTGDVASIEAGEELELLVVTGELEIAAVHVPPAELEFLDLIEFSDGGLGSRGLIETFPTSRKFRTTVQLQLGDELEVVIDLR